MKLLLRLLFGQYCSQHDQYFRSDFCGQCVRAREAKMKIHDDRKEWIRSEGSWRSGRMITKEDQLLHKENFEVGGSLYLVRCYACHKENWAPAVASGTCAWCGWGEAGQGEAAPGIKKVDTSL